MATGKLKLKLRYFGQHYSPTKDLIFHVAKDGQGNIYRIGIVYTG